MAQDISALVFDAYGTLFDVHSVSRLAETLFPGQGAALSIAWRSKQLEYTWLRSLMGRYEDFSRVTQSALEWTFESLRLEADEAARRSLLDEYRRLALICAARRLLCRAALFLWMMRLSAMASMVDCSVFSTAWAAAWSPAVIAFCTFLMALRRWVRRLTLAERCLTDFLARLAACLVLAICSESRLG
jgi:hypothetical protein